MTSEDIAPAYHCDACSVARAGAMCGHHYSKHKEALDKKAYEVIQLNKVEEEIPQLEKAVK